MKRTVKNDIESFLNQEIARARSLKLWSTAARASEALRCIRLLDALVCGKLFESLKGEYMQRSLYTQYLLHSRQILLSAQAYLEEYASNLFSKTFVLPWNFSDCGSKLNASESCAKVI